MRICPVCEKPMERVRYEGFPVHKCPGCHGVLLETGRIEQIKRKMQTEAGQLVADAHSERSDDTRYELSCPRCHGPMDKERAFEDDGPGRDAGMASFAVDVCGQCSITWLDGGELAKLQLNYERSPKGIESGKRYVSYDRLDERGKAEFLAAVAGSVPDRAASYASAFASAVSHAMRRRRWQSPS